MYSGVHLSHTTEILKPSPRSLAMPKDILLLHFAHFTRLAIAEKTVKKFIVL